MKTKIRILSLILLVLAVVSTAIAFSGFSIDELDFFDELSIYNEEKTIEVLKAHGYTYIYNLNEDIVKYCKEINGIKTDDSFGLLYSNGKLRSIRWSFNRLAKRVLPIRIEQTPEAASTIQYRGTAHKLVKTEKEIVYRNINKTMVPVEIKYNHYEPVDSEVQLNSLFIPESHTVYYNLYNGEVIDPECMINQYPNGKDNYINW